MASSNPLRGSLAEARAITTFEHRVSQVTGYASFSPARTASVATFCTCSDNATVTCPAKGDADPCPATKGQTDTRVFFYLAVQATQNFTRIIPWNFIFPSSLGAGTVVRLQ